MLVLHVEDLVYAVTENIFHQAITFTPAEKAVRDRRTENETVLTRMVMKE